MRLTAEDITEIHSYLESAIQESIPTTDMVAHIEKLIMKRVRRYKVQKELDRLSSKGVPGLSIYEKGDHVGLMLQVRDQKLLDKILESMWGVTCQI